MTLASNRTNHEIRVLRTVGHARGIYYNKLLAVPTARVARMLAPLAFSTGLSLLGALPPNPLSLYIVLLFLFSLRSPVIPFLFT